MHKQKVLEKVLYSHQNFESKGGFGLHNYKFTNDTYTHLAFMLYIWGINSLSRGMGTVQGGKPPHKRPSENTVISICTRGHSKSFCSCLDSLSKFESTIISLYVVFTTIERQCDDVVQSLSGSKGSTYLHQQCHLPSTSDTQSVRDLHLKFPSGEDM